MQFSSKPIFRFAPSPNGLLHLGHAYSALFTQFWAQKLGGDILVRIEDIDITRSKPVFVDAIFDDLQWLGLQWQQTVWQQSERFDHYSKAAQKLWDMGLLYPCFCTRKDIASTQQKQIDPDGAPLYPGTCKNLSKTQSDALIAKKTPHAWRLDMEEACTRVGTLTYSVAHPNPLERPHIKYVRPQKWGDVIIVRKDTPTSYHLSVVVDDAAQNISHITRGADLREATDIHVLLQFLLGLPAPLYTHHQLIKDEGNKKLSKSKGAPSLASLREQGWTAQKVRAHLGFD